MKSKAKRPKISLLHDEIPPHVQEFMHLTRLAEMGRLAANVAHELNNPLMVAQGFAENIELLLDSDPSNRDEIRLQTLEIIKACQRMARIINKMNRMSRSQRLRLHIVDLAEIALNAVDFIKKRIEDEEVTIAFDFDRPVPIKCDAVQIEQIILNILTNAIFALGGQGGPRDIRISFADFGRWQQVKIWNNGPLIPKEVQSKLMAPFFTTKAEGEGTGLGLAVSRAIMQVHGGELTFRSEDGFGTEFQLSFPRPKENPWHQRERENKGVIVLIDPQANYRRTLQEKFHLLGFRVQAYPTFEAGIEGVRALENVAGVLIDVIPGQKQSSKFVRDLREQVGARGLIFTLSNYPSARDSRGELKSAGATECFEKPIHADHFTFILKMLDAADKLAG